MAGNGDSGSHSGFLEYHEPNSTYNRSTCFELLADSCGRTIAVEILVLLSFFFFLALAEWVSDRIFKAGLLGQIIVGVIYGVPVGNIMPIGWQETFVSLGYIGLILIIFEGGLQARQRSPLLTSQGVSRYISGF